MQMSGRFVLLTFLLGVILCGNAHALSSKEKKLLKKLQAGAKATYDEKTFTISSTSGTVTKLAMFGFVFSSTEDATRVVEREAKGEDAVDFVGTFENVKKEPFEETKRFGYEEAMIGGKWWAQLEEKEGWFQPDPNDDKNADLLETLGDMNDDATGEEVFSNFKTGGVESIKKIDGRLDGAVCYKGVPTKEAIKEIAGEDDFSKAMLGADSAEIYAEACIDKKTGLMMTCDVFIKSGDFDVVLEGFSTTVKEISFDDKSTYSKFGEAVEFPDVSPPS